ncbi:hypothetical protein ACKFKF_34365 [Phormidesmis sp. 146-12]
MDISKENQQPSIDSSPSSAFVDEPLRAIAYSMDALIPGLYIWVGAFKLRIEGSLPEENYPGTLHSFAGIAIALPGYQIYTTYHGSYDPR